MKKHSFIFSLVLFAVFIFAGVGRAELTDITQGTLRVVGQESEAQQFPLKHTDVDARISGFLYNVSVTQTFENPYARKIEAVYIFPLPHEAAVNNMQIKVGERIIKSLIKRREEARKIYENAKRTGKVAALLDQERPNIFTQSVANIMPGEEIKVTIEYVGAMAYEDGGYSFVFPMVVGPRYIPGKPQGGISKGGGWAPDTDQVPDASRITPPVLPPTPSNMRSGHDIQVSVQLDAGVPIRNLFSKSHRVMTNWEGKNRASVKLESVDTIPNKDFILEYEVAGEKPEIALLTHRPDTKGEGYFMLMIQPKANPSIQEITSKEMIFVVDNSGSMSGAPIAQAKELMRRFVGGMNPGDSFQIIRFSERASGLSTLPLPNTPANVTRGLRFIDAMRGMGGTRMLEGIKAALDYPADPDRLRIVAFLTDGYIGNETQIYKAIEERLGNARLFSFGVGSSVNRYLLDGMARIGRGMVEYVRQDEKPDTAADKFYKRISNPYLVDIQADWNGLQVTDLYPSRIPDLFTGQPIVVYGRYSKPGDAVITIYGKIAGKDYVAQIPVDLPAKTNEHVSIASIWARMRIKELMDKQHGGTIPDIKEEITELALSHRLVSAYTSFVAVEEQITTPGGEPTQVMVPVNIPEGVSYEGVFGKTANLAMPGSASVLPEKVYKQSAQRGNSYSRVVKDEKSKRRHMPFYESSSRIDSLVSVEEMKMKEYDKSEVQAISCSITLDENKFKAGENVGLTLKLKNNTSRDLQISTYGWPYLDIYLTIVAEHGHVLKRLPVKVIKMANFSPSDIVRLKAGQTLERKLANPLSLYETLTPGKYILKLTLTHRRALKSEWCGELNSNLLKFTVVK